jgi:hypothetical protein
MPITLDGSGTITGLSAGGLPDLSVTTAEIAAGAITAPKLDGAQSGTAPIYGARAWVNFNGTGVIAIRASGNVSSITDNGVGDYTVNFTTAMVDGKYMVALGQPSGSLGSLDGRQQGMAVVHVSGDYPTTGVRVSGYNQVSGGVVDLPQANVAIFR